MKRWIDRTVGALVSVSLLAAAGFFYVEIRRDEALTAQYRRTVEAISATRMLASQWSIEVEKVRNEVNSNFDILAGFIDRMDRHVAVIREAPKALPSLPARVKWSLNGYVQRLKAQEERIERFKSGFAIVRNSRRFIPREGGELAEAARDGGHGKLETATLQIMAETEDFLSRPTEVQRQRMERTMRVLAGSAGGTALRGQADTLNKHVRALLRHYGLTEQRFRDVLGSDLEDRAEQAIGLLDADHASGREMRRYYDYGLLLALGLVVSYWGFLAMRWMDRRRKRRRAAERAPEAALQERGAPILDVEAAWASAGASPGIPMSADLPPEAGTAEPQRPPAPARRARERGAGQARVKFAAGGRPGLSLAERLRTRSGSPAGREEPAREERPPSAGDVQAGEPARTRQEESSHGAARARQASAVPADAEAAPVAYGDAEEERRLRPGGHEAPAVERPERTAEEYREAEGGVFRGRGPLSARLEALAKGVRPVRDEGSAAQAGEPARTRHEEPSHEAARARQASAVPAEAAPVDGDRAFGGQEPAPPDRTGIVHWAVREAVLERLREVEREIRAAADAAGQAERISTDGSGEGRQEAWAAAAGRMAGVRWEVLTLLNEADRLPSAPAPAGDPEPIDLRALIDARLDALAAEDRERIGATLAPQAVTRGRPQALEGVVELILEHALEGARLHSGGQGRVTVTLAEEHGAVHLTCLTTAREPVTGRTDGALALAAARRLAEEQDGAMEITPYPGHGTMIRLRLPLHGPSAAPRAPAHGAGEEGRDGGAASREEP